MKLTKLMLLLLFMVLSTIQSLSQTKLRRDVLLMVDSIEMAYSRACPEICIKKVDSAKRIADETVIKKLNTFYYHTSTFAAYRSDMEQNGFIYQSHNDIMGKKHSTFSSSEGNLAIVVDIKYKGDSIITRNVYIETHSHAYCYRKNGDFIQYSIDIFYIHSLVPLINFQFNVSLAEPTFTKADMDNE